ncbi:MAG: PP2C family protein-serine/threonine phosphatase [Bacteroidota bacterium]
MESSEEIIRRINDALAREEIRAEHFANRVRVFLISILLIVALFNVGSLGAEANIMNLGVIFTGYMYGFAVFLSVRRGGSVARLKYITSFLDIFLVMLLLFLYTRIETPTVALKNYVFLIVFPLILLTTFRFDRWLTLATGSWAIFLYVGLLLYLSLTKSVVLQHNGYMSELFSADVTYIGQMTKVFILICFVGLATYLAGYSRDVIQKTIQREVTHRIENDALVRELEVASDVQQQLLPRLSPEIAGLQYYGTVIQGKFVGGDYFDFLKVSGSKLLAVIADVSGKGVPAALIMAEVRASTHLLAGMNLSLPDFVRRLNRLVLESTARRDYVTYFIAEINPAEHVMKYINAGHPPPCIVSGNSLQTLSTRTLALGLRDELPQLKEECAPFASGSIFVGYTDGILERTSPDGIEYGEEKLKTYLRGAQTADVRNYAGGILNDVRNFGGDKPFDDDATLVVVRALERYFKH